MAALAPQLLMPPVPSLASLQAVAEQAGHAGKARPGADFETPRSLKS